MAPKFGTSGLRGLVTELTPALVTDHITAFVRACPVGAGVHVGHDLRDSSPVLAEVVTSALREAGVPVTLCGPVPTPALALAAMAAGQGAVMITGSHIPADRNGLKFYTPRGEITKIDEAAILAQLGQGGIAARPMAQAPLYHANPVAPYVERYSQAFAGALQGLTLGFYAQSAVGRDLMPPLLRALGADVTVLGWSDAFIPVDTEAVSEDLRAQLRDWAADGNYDAILSTDADGDRPLLADAGGTVIPGDVLGQIAGTVLRADLAVTPVSSNTGAEQVFDRVIRTRIGSPFVIAAMETAGGRVLGYEANGGTLLGYDASGPAGPLAALMTRDAVLPLLTALAEAARRGGLAKVLAAQPARFTASDRMENTPTAQSQALIADLRENASHRAGFLQGLDLSEAATDETDGLRITTTAGSIVHLRPSGNAPELRIYTEAASVAAAQALLEAARGQVRSLLGT